MVFIFPTNLILSFYQKSKDDLLSSKKNLSYLDLYAFFQIDGYKIN